MLQPTPQDLPKPIAAQCLASDGRLFQFMCLQLNTTKLDSDDGIKNMVGYVMQSCEFLFYL